MSRRGGQLTRVALRLGLLIGGVVGAWSVYDAVTAHVALAAEAPRPVTVDAGTGLRPSPLSAVDRWTGRGADLSQSPDPFGFTTRTDEVTASSPKAPARQGTGSTAGTDPQRAARTPDRRTRCDAPDRRAGRSPTTTGRAAPGTTATRARGEAPATEDRPVTRPILHSPSPVSNQAPRGHQAAPRPHDPTPPGAGPAPRTPERPTGPSAAPSVDPGAAHPAEDKDKDEGKKRGEHPPTPRTEPAAASQPVAAAVAETMVTRVTVTHRYPATADRRSPGDDLEPGGHADVARIVVSTAPAPRPMRPDAGPAPDLPAPGNSSAGTSHTAHADAADASAVGWTPLLARGEARRPARADALSSRSPRPGSRPA